MMKEQDRLVSAIVELSKKQDKRYFWVQILIISKIIPLQQESLL